MGVDLAKYQKQSKVTRPKKEKATGGVLSKEISFSKKFSNKKKEQFYRELAILIRSGVDFQKALDIIISQYPKKKDQALIKAIQKEVVSGKSLHESMQKTGEFSAYEYYSVRIGEETRKLQPILLELQQFFERKIKMRRQLVSVFTYPAMVLAVTILVLYFMLNNVVPMFSSVFTQFGGELPSLTKKIIALSEVFPTVTLVFLLLVLGLIAFHLINKEKTFYRRGTSLMVSKIPFFGKLIKKIYVSRFCQSLNLLLAAKTPLVTSLGLLEKMLGYYPLEATIEPIKSDIMKGLAFHKSLEKHKVYDRKMVSMIQVAEEINELDTMFKKLTDQYNEEIEHQTKMIGVVLEPLIIIIIGLVVGVIMVAMYSPMFDLSKIINGG